VLFRVREHGGHHEAMDLNKMLSDLRAEREQVEQAILVLSRLVVGQKRRGRPPKWMAHVESAKPKKRPGRPPGGKNKLKTEAEA